MHNLISLQNWSFNYKNNYHDFYPSVMIIAHRILFSSTDFFYGGCNASFRSEISSLLPLNSYIWTGVINVTLSGKMVHFLWKKQFFALERETTRKPLLSTGWKLKWWLYASCYFTAPSREINLRFLQFIFPQLHTISYEPSDSFREQLF